MQWIDENDLKAWAKHLDARQLLIEMVSDLIRATIADASRFRFPGGDAGQVRGFDGDLETTEAVSVIPAGKSKWEFGVATGAKKAKEDYDKRTEKTPTEMMRENALVMVNLETWDTPRENLAQWEADRRAEGKWRDVKYIDGTALVEWLKETPAVAARYAREVLKTAPKDGALSTDEFWEEYSAAFKPRLTEKVVLCDRAGEAEQLLAQLLGPADSLIIGAESSEDVVAFAVAAIRAAPPEKRLLLESRTLIVATEEAARFLSAKKNMVFVTTKGGDALAGMLSSRGPTLSAATGAQKRKHRILARPSASAMAEALRTMGFSRQDGYELAHRCGRSLTILRRLNSNGPTPAPTWEGSAATLKPAFLAGGWQSSVALDKEVVAGLAGVGDYLAFERVLRPLCAAADPPIDNAGDVWQARSPVDAFPYFGPLVDAQDLTRLRDAALRVFSHRVDPPKPDELFQINYSPRADFSSWLRDGLAFTLLLFASMPDVGGLHVEGKTPQQYVDEVVSAIPDFGKSHKSLLAILDQAAILAEAAPNPFLSALESMLGGAHNEAKHLFTSKGEDWFGPSSPHISILWALEVLAWDPALLQRVALILARLAELDPEPESRMVNRPINSLRAILLSWSPNTHARLPQRIACLDSILRHVPAIGWDLLVKLLPRPQDTSSPTQTPKLRDVSPLEPENLTYGLVWESEAAIIDRAIQLANGHEDRVVHMVKNFAFFQANSRASVLQLIEGFLSENRSSEGNPVWRALREEIGKHRYFASSDWAMSPEELSALDVVLERYRPTDLIATERQFFDDWNPYVGTMEDEREEVDAHRTHSLERVWKEMGPRGIVKLAETVNQPSLIGEPLSQLKLTAEELRELVKLGLASSKPLIDLPYQASAIGARAFGSEWLEIFRKDIASDLPPDQVASLMAGWPIGQSTWSAASSLGAAVEQAYWKRLNFLPQELAEADLLHAIAKLRHEQRSIDVLCMLHRRARVVSTDLLLELLDEAYGQLAGAAARHGGMLSYYLGEIFDAIATRGDANLEAVARREYMYLPALRSERKSLILHRFMADDPEFFVEVLTHVFRGKSETRDREVSEQDRARARTSYELLTSFTTVPGTVGGQVDADVLKRWVDGARKIAAERDRTEITDSYIGRVLAHSPADPDSGAWPHKAVSAVLEHLSSDDVERGIDIERHNMRGVVRKTINADGGQERDLAKMYAEWASKAQAFPRTFSMLTRFAADWNTSAQREDVRAEQGKMKM